MLVRELMESLTLEDRGLDYNNAPNYQPQAAVFAQPEMSLKELMISLPPLDAPDDCVKLHQLSNLSTTGKEGLSLFEFVFGWDNV
ncbi:hypothetical protein EUGRSUZ_I02572 [Eucalyptus grandis]|uniref:Uncharacterized protein n=3 Tax=Eucalyptus TaxID=3932 RepID=A0ACC3JLK0_EUCGR|nr:hypothetical protein EUGRSUZ_I02572 [Eucalyptus grandis]